jgi:glycerophosphoryl diester phosphodiesterase
MKIIGHRGARGLAPENSLAAIKKGIANGVDAVEFDIRLTKDKVLVLIHDPNLLRLASNSSSIDDLTLKQLRAININSGERIPTLKEVFQSSGKTQLIIEGKGNDWARPLLAELKEYKGPPPAIISKNHYELYRFSCRRPDLETYAVSLTNPFEPVDSATKYGFTGIDINFWLINPVVYFLARRAKLKIIVYTINSPLLLAFLKFLYPKIIAITTDYPNRFASK